MKIGIVGLGLIGGSTAKAYKTAGHIVYGYDTDSTIQGYAKLSGVIDDLLSPEKYAECELLILAATPKAMVAYLDENGASIPASTTLIDFCGIKGEICRKGFELARRYGFTYVGGHPMAGSQYSGFKHSRPTLFKGASMIIVPPVYDDMELLERVKQLLAFNMEKGTQTKERRWLTEVGKGRESPLEPPEGRQPCQHLHFSPVRPRLNF